MLKVRGMEQGTLPKGIIEFIELEGDDLKYGMIKLEIFMRDGKPTKWQITRLTTLKDSSVPIDIDGYCIEREEGIS